MMKEQVLISEDTVEINAKLGEIERSVVPQLEIVKKAFEKLSIGTLTNSRLKSLLFDDWRILRSELAKEMTELNDNVMLDQVVQKQIKSSLGILGNKLQEFSESGSAYLKYYISIDETGKFFVPDESMEELKDMSRVYVTSAKGLELYDAHKAAAKALNDFYTLAKEDMTANISCLINLFDIGEAGTVIPAEQDYERYVYAHKTGKKKGK
mgnify:FL=1|jgi:hypothetical protein